MTWFGGKSRAAGLIWPRFGDAPNYIEPFAGGLAVLLARPHAPRVETVNDRDAYLANFWRAVQHDPDQVAAYADGPVNETDLHARHRWLVETGAARVDQLTTDPDYFDAKVAGWWVWGLCLWIGSGWCAPRGYRGRNGGDLFKKRPHTDRGSGRGVHSGDMWQQRPDLTNPSNRGGVLTVQKRPAASGNGQAGGVHRRWNSGGAGAGQGVHAPTLARQFDKSAQGHGINARGFLAKQESRRSRQIPVLRGDGNSAGNGLESARVIAHTDGLYGYMRDLAARLRRVRVCCGDWTRVLTPSVTTYIGFTAVLLDPPYDQSRRSVCYNEDHDISADVRAWALEHGDDPKFRIALCGYEGEHDMPASWECVPWVAGGGYGRSERGKGNRRKERIWFSPHCLRPSDQLVFHDDNTAKARP